MKIETPNAIGTPRIVSAGRDYPANAATAQVVTANADSETVMIETRDSSIELAAGGNLLDALLDSGHAVEYQCRSGYCGACRVTATHGQVEYDEYPLALLNADEILPCCCRVTEPLKLAVHLREGLDAEQGELFP